jgi:hypothetical protein
MLQILEEYFGFILDQVQRRQSTRGPEAAALYAVSETDTLTEVTRSKKSVTSTNVSHVQEGCLNVTAP